MSFEPGSSSTPPMACATTRLPPAWTRQGRSSASGANATSNRALPACWSNLVAGAQLAFPPSVVLSIKALACELPHEHELPLSQLSIPEIRAEAIKRGIVASIGETTVWRRLSEDAIRPWTHRSWVFPRDPARGPTSPHGMCVVRKSMAAVNARPASPPSHGSSRRSWIRNLTARPSVCSG